MIYLDIKICHSDYEFFVLIMGIYWFSHGGLRAAYWRFCYPICFFSLKTGPYPTSLFSLKLGSLLNLPLLVEAGAYSICLFSSKMWPTKAVSSRRRRGPPCRRRGCLRGLLYAAEASAHAAGHHVSSEASQRTPSSVATRATAFIIGFGPQVEIWSKRSCWSTLWLVTKPVRLPIRPRW